MEKLAGIAAASFVVALSGAVAPGPVLAVTIAGTRARGFWFGPLVILGHALVELPVVALLALGLGTMLHRPGVLAAIGLAGGAAMAWMGLGLVRQAFRSGPEQAAGALARMGGVRSGALTSALNPYWYVWWVTAGAAMLTSAALAGWLGVAVFFAGHITADLAWYTLVAATVTGGRKLLQGRLYRGLLMVCGVTLVVMAGLFGYLGVTKVLEATSGAPPREETRLVPNQKISGRLILGSSSGTFS